MCAYYTFIYSQYISLMIFYIKLFIMFSVYIYVTHKNICDSCRFSLLSFILSFLPLLFLSQSLVFVAVVFIVFIILLLVCQYSASCLIVFSASFVSCSRCYWVFFFVCNCAIIATDCWSVYWTCLWSVISVSFSVAFSFSFLFAFSSLFSFSARCSFTARFSSLLSSTCVVRSVPFSFSFPCCYSLFCYA